MRFPIAAPLMVALLAASALPAALPAAPASITAAQRAAKFDVIRTDLIEQLPKLEQQLEQHKNMSVRQVTNGALAALAVNGDVRQAEFFLRTALALQVTDPNAREYGNFPWETSPTSRVTDYNSMAFTAEPLGPLLKLYGDRLDAPMRRLLVS